MRRLIAFVLIISLVSPAFTQVPPEQALEEMQRILSGAAAEMDLKRLEELKAEIAAAGSEDELAEAEYLLFLAGEIVRERSGEEATSSLDYSAAESLESGLENGNSGFWLSTTGGLLGLGLYGLFTGFYAAASDDYNQSTDPKDRENLGDQRDLWNAARLASLGLGTASLTAAALLIPTPEPEAPRSLYELRYRYASLEGDAAMRMERILKDQSALMAELEESRIEAEPFILWRNVSLISAGTFALSTAVFLILGDSAYRQYNEAAFSDDAEEKRQTVETYGLLSAGSGILTALSLGSAGALELLRPRPEDVEAQLTAYETFIRQERLAGRIPAK